MAGATTAAPLDAIGALYWNPATIAGLPAPELGVGADFLLAKIDLSSSNGPVSGSTSAKPGPVLIPNIGWVHRTSNPNVSLGLGILSVAGFKTNYPASYTNPILTPQPNGVGRLYSEAQFAQLTPVISLRLSERLAVAAGPMVTVGMLAADPLLFVAPNSNGYPSGRGTQASFGGGFQGGVFFQGRNTWNFGASIKSPQWMQKFQYTTEDAAGAPRSETFGLDLPMIVSVGAAYRGIENVLWTFDYRYFDYSRAKALGDEGFDSDGALLGVGWRSVNALATGIQYRINEGLVVRGGYGLNQSPIEPKNAGLNIASPLVQTQNVHIGSSLSLNRQATLNLSYTYFPANEVAGPIQTFLRGPLPGSSVASRLIVHTVSMGIVVTY